MRGYECKGPNRRFAFMKGKENPAVHTPEKEGI